MLRDSGLIAFLREDLTEIAVGQRRRCRSADFRARFRFIFRGCLEVFAPKHLSVILVSDDAANPVAEMAFLNEVVRALSTRIGRWLS